MEQEKEERTEQTQSAQTSSNVHQIFGGGEDVRKVAGDVAVRTVKVLELFKKYSSGMSERDKKSFALWIRDAYEREEPSSDEELFMKVHDEFMKDKKEEEEEKKEDRQRVSPKGQEIPKPKEGVTPIETTPHYPLADDETYFRARKAHFEGTRTIKRRMPDERDLIQSLLQKIQ